MTLLWGAHIWHVLTRDHPVLPATYIFIHEWDDPCLYLHSVTTLWLVLISRPAMDRRLSWPGWLVTYRGDLPVRRQSPIQIYFPSPTYGNFVDRGQRVTTTRRQHRRRRAAASISPFSSVVQRCCEVARFIHTYINTYIRINMFLRQASTAGPARHYKCPKYTHID